MGYYTEYILTMRNFLQNDTNGDYTLAKVSKDVFLDIAKYIYESISYDFLSFEEECCFEGHCKWYEHDEDMCSLSMKFPNILFELTGNGEAPHDLWKTYYLNGCKQHCNAIIKFDTFSLSKLKKIF